MQILPIKIDLKNKDSLKKGVLTLRDSVLSFYEEYYEQPESYRAKYFVSLDDKLFTKDDFADTEIIDEITKYYRFLYKSQSNSFEELSDIQKEYYSVFSQAIVIQNALTYPELKDLIIKLAKDIAKEFNTKKTDCVDGVCIDQTILLTLILRSYPSYAYLMGEFIAEESNFHHVVKNIEGFAHLYDKFGLDDNILNMFASCRYLDIFDAMKYAHHSCPDISTYLYENNKYELYKQYFLEYIKRNPQGLMPPNESQFTRASIFIERALAIHDDLSFGKNIKKEIKEFESEVFNLIKDIPLKDLKSYENCEEYFLFRNSDKTLSELKKDEFINKKYDSSEDIDVANKNFFTNEFENGDKIWDYIEENKNVDILNSLKPIRNIKKIAYEKKYDLIIKRLPHYSDIEQNVTIGELKNIFIHRYFKSCDEEYTFSLKQKVLRFCDVLLCLCDDDMVYFEPEIFKSKYLKKRFKQHTFKSNDKDEIITKIEEFSSLESIGSMKLGMIYRFYTEDKAFFEEFIKSKKDDQNLASYLLIASFILSKEQNKTLEEFYKENIYRCFDESVKEYIVQEDDTLKEKALNSLSSADIFTSKNTAILIASFFYVRNYENSYKRIYELFMEISLLDTLPCSFYEYSTGKEYYKQAIYRDVANFSSILSTWLGKKYGYLSKIFITYKINSDTKDMNSFTVDSKGLYEELIVEYKTNKTSPFDEALDLLTKEDKTRFLQDSSNYKIKETIDTKDLSPIEKIREFLEETCRVFMEKNLKKHKRRYGGNQKVYKGVLDEYSTMLFDYIKGDVSLEQLRDKVFPDCDDFEQIFRLSKDVSFAKDKELYDRVIALVESSDSYEVIEDVRRHLPRELYSDEEIQALDNKYLALFSKGKNIIRINDFENKQDQVDALNELIELTKDISKLKRDPSLSFVFVDANTDGFDESRFFGESISKSTKELYIKVLENFAEYFTNNKDDEIVHLVDEEDNKTYTMCLYYLCSEFLSDEIYELTFKCFKSYDNISFWESLLDEFILSHYDYEEDHYPQIVKEMIEYFENF